MAILSALSLPGVSGQPIFFFEKRNWVARIKRAMTEKENGEEEMSADQDNPSGAGGQMSSGVPRNAISRQEGFHARTGP
jgi:hypothetical protein